jgi:hypothetical protein
LINITQFVIMNEAGPVAGTVVGHIKTCTIVVLGWIYSGKQLKDGSHAGIVLAIAGITAYVPRAMLHATILTRSKLHIHYATTSAKVTRTQYLAWLIHASPFVRSALRTEAFAHCFERKFQ